MKKNIHTERAYAHIRQAILRGMYRPGQPLLTEDVSREIGVSRTPVRDALRQLEAEGLVSIRPRLGASVRTLGLTEYRDMCGMRLALESYAAGLAARNRDAEELEELARTIGAMRQGTERLITAAHHDLAIIDELRQADIRFHIIIIGAARNKLIKREVLRLHIVSRVLSVGNLPLPDKRSDSAHRRQVQREHEAIFAAIERGDVDDAKLCMERHIQPIVDANLREMSLTIGESVGAGRVLSEDELGYTV